MTGATRQALAAADDITAYNHEHDGGPLFIPRNRMLDRAIMSAEHDSDLQPYFELLTAVTHPYNAEAGPTWMAEPEGDEGGSFVTYCGT